jgi:ABC-type amino acid transport system permease subunit
MYYVTDIWWSGTQLRYSGVGAAIEYAVASLRVNLRSSLTPFLSLYINFIRGIPDC